MTLYRLEELTWPKCRDLGASEAAVGLVPLGSLEQHGPHLPLSTDTWIVERLADEVAARIETDVIVSPVIALGLSSHHLGFPGTISVPPEVLAGSLDSVVDGFTSMGVKRVAVISWHGGNFGFLGEYLERRTALDGATLVAYSDLDRFFNAMFEAAEEQGATMPSTDVHAGGIETSIVLHLFPGRIVGDYPDLHGYVDGSPGWMEVLFADGVHALSGNGVLGDPAVASASIGRQVFERIVGDVTAWLVDELGLDAVAASP